MATSGSATSGHHIGDLAEYPFYHRRAFRNELAVCAAWLAEEAEPVVFDIGANVGFICTHLAKMNAKAGIRIYAFEPVDMTFVKLVQSVERLGLEHCIRAVAAAVLDESNPVRLQYPQGNSLYAQITPQQFEPRAGSMLAHAAGITLDGFYGSSGILPSLLKIDVEGYEVAVPRGAQGMLARLDRSALVFEYYPILANAVQSPPHSQLLADYSLYYVDDFEGQRMPLGRRIDRLEQIEWGCNVFAVPALEGCSARWASALHSAHHRIRALG